MICWKVNLGSAEMVICLSCSTCLSAQVQDSIKLAGLQVGEISWAPENDGWNTGSLLQNRLNHRKQWKEKTKTLCRRWTTTLLSRNILYLYIYIYCTNICKYILYINKDRYMYLHIYTYPCNYTNVCIFIYLKWLKEESLSFNATKVSAWAMSHWRRASIMRHLAFFQGSNPSIESHDP